MYAAPPVLALSDDGAATAVYVILASGLVIFGILAFSMSKIELDERWYTALPFRILRWSLLAASVVLAIVVAGGLMVT